MDWLLPVLVFAPPLGTGAWFVYSLVCFLKTPKAETEERKTRKIMMITSAVIFGALIAAILTLGVLFVLAIKHM